MKKKWWTIKKKRARFFYAFSSIALIMLTLMSSLVVPITLPNDASAATQALPPDNDSSDISDECKKLLEQLKDLKDKVGASSQHEDQYEDIRAHMALESFLSANQPKIDECQKQLQEQAKKMGAQGAQDSQGAQGAQGAQDSQGAQGAQGAQDSQGAHDDGECTENAKGFGWIMCPGGDMLSNTVNQIMTWINRMLSWSILATNSADSNKSSPQGMWSSFVKVANIVFAIAFVIMIYSMATSTGLSNYEIKKILPRLILIAIAVNVSFYLCLAAIDLSNVIGSSVFEVFTTKNISTDYSWTLRFKSFMGTIGLIIFGISMIGTVMLAIAVIYIALLTRQIALVALTILSPLAFAAALLPNTKKYFDKWKDYFGKLLIVYPMFTALWGGSIWLRAIVGNNDEQFGNATMAQLAITIAPVFAIKPMMAASGGIMAASANMANRGLARTGIHSKINGVSSMPAKSFGRWAGRNTITRSKRGVNGFVASRMGGSRFAIGRALAHKAGMFQRDAQTAMDAPSVERQELAEYTLQNMSPKQKQDLVKSGNYVNDRGKTLKAPIELRQAAIASEMPNMFKEDIATSMQSVYADADKLPARQATAIRATALAAASKAGVQLDASYANDYITGSLVSGGAGTFSDQYKLAEASMWENTTASSISKESAKDLKYMKDTRDYINRMASGATRRSVSNPHLISQARAVRSAIDRPLKDAAGAAIASPALTANMSADTHRAVSNLR